MRFPRQLARTLRVYARTAWWGLVAPRLIERERLVVAQAVVLAEVSGAPRLLLSVRSDVQGWELPGGNPEPGETLDVALRREVREETGLEVVVERHVGDYTRRGFRPHVARVFVCSVAGGALRPSRETPVVKFFPPDALPDTLFPWYREPIDDALANRERPVSRSEYQGLAAIWAGLRIDLTMRLRGLPDAGEDR